MSQLKSIGKSRQPFKTLISQGYTYTCILKLHKAQEKMLDFFSVYNTCTLLEKYVDANLDAPGNVILGNGSSSEMLTCQSQIPE